MNDQSRDVSEVPKAEDSSIFRDLSPEAINEPAVDAPPVEEPAVEELAVEELAVEELAVEERSAEPIVEAAAAGKAGEISFSKPDNSILGDHKIAFTSNESDSCQAVRIRVSSKHFTLVSSVFRSMFKDIYSEGLSLYSQSHTELSLPYDNSAAFFIILHFIHGQIRKVPRKIDLWMFIELAILVDKYEFLKSVEFLLNHWLQNLKNAIPLIYNNDLLP